MIRENLKLIRKELGLSISKFSEKLGIPAPTLTCYERGERTPSAQLFVQLHIKLDVNLNWFVSGKGNMFNYKSEQQDSFNDEFEQRVLQILKRNSLIK